MLKIKLARFGKRGQPQYRIVVNEAKDKRDGSYVDNIGQYAPTQQPKILKIDLDRFYSWVAQGAQPTDTVSGLVKRFESGNPFPAKKAKLSKKTKTAAASKAEAKANPEETAAPQKTAEPAAQPETETPTTESKAEPTSAA